jgi:asparagine synthase (glutamine-hydrolysing)
VSDADGVALAMRRLSIVDLVGGHQPMVSPRQGNVTVFNGEIYNHASLREELVSLGHRFETDHSDTEVLVHGYEQWGVKLFARLNGMFAVAIWDPRMQAVVVARDRVGEKPLYIGHTGSGYAIASELKALLALRDLDHEIDAIALEQLLSFDYILAPRTILRAAQKLPAGHYGVISRDSCSFTPYWELTFTDAGLGRHEVLERLDRTLDKSVSLRMVADVPVGLFLSGGVDSTAIGYYMARHSSQVQSFSIGFEQPHYDETRFAELAARHLGLAHHVEILSEDRIRDLVPRVTELLDEPMADQSIFPTYFLSVFARGHVKVALGGDGSDEFLMGYRAYQALKVAWMLDRLPASFRQSAARSAVHLPESVMGVKVRGKRFAQRLDCSPSERLLSCLGSFAGDARWILSADVAARLPSSVFSALPIASARHMGRERSAADETIATYVSGYLQEDILVKVDRASMAASLEVRSPFLDPDFISFVASVPAHSKMPWLRRKHLLRTLMRGRVPDEILDRRKQGFGVPVNAWLRTSLAPILQDTLNAERVRETGLFDVASVTRLVREHVDGRIDHGQRLWPLLLIELWRQRWLDGANRD